MASSAGAEFREFADRLAAVADARIATDAAQLLADVWTDTAIVFVGKDTHQLERRIRVVAITGSASRAVGEVEADTPYAGYHNYGNSSTAPNRFWDLGMEAAERYGNRLSTYVSTGIERMLVSGGVWNPRRDL